MMDFIAGKKPEWAYWVYGGAIMIVWSVIGVML